jgi:hypothetical protein
LADALAREWSEEGLAALVEAVKTVEAVEGDPVLLAGVRNFLLLLE